VSFKTVNADFDLGRVHVSVGNLGFIGSIARFSLSERSPAVLRFSTSFKRDGSASLNTWHPRPLNRITIGSLGRRSDRPDIGGDLVAALVPAGRGRLILMYSQSTSGATQPGERTATARSGDVSSTRQHSIMGHATQDFAGTNVYWSVTRTRGCEQLSRVVSRLRTDRSNSRPLADYSFTYALLTNQCQCRCQ